jgi:hypothetical protein
MGAPAGESGLFEDAPIRSKIRILELQNKNFGQPRQLKTN